MNLVVHHPVFDKCRFASASLFKSPDFFPLVIRAIAVQAIGSCGRSATHTIGRSVFGSVDLGVAVLETR